MAHLSRILRNVVIALAVAAGACAVIVAVFRLSSARNDGTRYETMRGWQPIGGRWSLHEGIFSNATYGRGDMLIAQHSEESNYVISADIRFDLLFPETRRGNSGLVIRTTNPEQGVDSYQGYYAGLIPSDQTVVLGRASYDWRELKTVPLAAPVFVGEWYHLAIEAKGCMLTVTATPPNGAPTTRLEYHDPQCLTKGVAGLRSFYAQTSWRNVKIADL